MTPCEKLGYKVGDRFEVVTQSGSDAQVGWVVVLYEDDGSICPFFYKVGEEFGRNYCPKLTEIRPLKTQTEAEKRGAKFGTMGVVKATGTRWVFSCESCGLWKGINDKGIVVAGDPSNIRLDHEPEYKEIPFSEATHEQRMDVGNLIHGGDAIVKEIYCFQNGGYAYTTSWAKTPSTALFRLTVRIPT